MTDKVLDRVRDLLPALRDRAVEAEEQRRVPDASIAELTEAGVFRMLQLLPASAVWRSRRSPSTR